MLTVPLTIQNSEQSVVTAIVDTGANCSCINIDFYKRYLSTTPLSKLTMKTVKQASGSSIGAMGTLDMKFEIQEKPFCQKFIVCSSLKMAMILGLDFAQTYRIGIDWDDTMAPYLRTAGKFLVKAMPLKSLTPTRLVQEIHLKEQRNTAKTVSDIDSHEHKKMKITSVSKKPKSMVRLLTKTQVRLPPKTLSVIPVNMRLPVDKPNLRNIDVMGYENF